jgi:YVTN family beta-propeller protein
VYGCPYTGGVSQAIRQWAVWVGVFAGVLPFAAAQNVATGQQPIAIALNENTHKAYIANHGSSSVTVIDGRTKSAVATVKTGSSPEGIAVDTINAPGLCGKPRRCDYHSYRRR